MHTPSSKVLPKNHNECEEESEEMNLVAHWMTVFSHLTHWDAHSQVPDPQADCTTHATSTLRVLLTCLQTHTHTGLRALSHYKYINMSSFDSSKQAHQCVHLIHHTMYFLSYV